MNHRVIALALLAGLCAVVALLSGCGGGGGGGSQPFTLAGTITSDTGSPVSGARVTETPAGGTQPVAATTSSSTGVFAFALPLGVYFVEATAAGFQPNSKLVDISAAPDLSVSIVLSQVGPPPPPPFDLGGKVTSAASGQAIAGATVTATLSGQTTPADTTTTDANGDYTFWLATGSYVVRASATGFQAAQQTVTVPNLSVNFALTPL
jgi:hypothetical protein